MILLLIFKDIIYYQASASETSIDITIEQIPDYKGAFVSDGVDDYGLCENFPTLTPEKGYTVLAIRKWITIKNNAGFVSKDYSPSSGEFIFEYGADNINLSIRNYGSAVNVGSNVELFSYMNSKVYNGKIIPKGTASDFKNKLFLFKIRDNSVYSNIALYALEIYDHDLTDEEIQAVKARMIREYEEGTGLPYDETGALIADYEAYDKTNDDEDRDVLADRSGNGRDITLYNFGFAEGSGYGLYGANFTRGYYVNASNKENISVNKNSFSVKNVLALNSLVYKPNNGSIPSMKIRVTGVNNNEVYYIYYNNSTRNRFDFPSDGIYTVPESEAQETNTDVVGFFCSIPNTAVGVTIEQIPEYAGALVSDGVDDYGLCENFPIFTKENGYTMLILRDWILRNGSNQVLVSDNKDTTIGEYITVDNNIVNNVTTRVFGTGTIVKSYFNQKGIVVCSSSRYNDFNLSKIGETATQPQLRIFRSAYVALYALKIFNRDLTDEEITIEKAKMIKRFEEKTGQKYVES